MDLSKLNLNELANKGSVMELLHPITDEVLTDKEEVYDAAVQKIESNNKLSDEEKQAKIEALPQSFVASTPLSLPFPQSLSLPHFQI